jgi:hypothetical protein
MQTQSNRQFLFAILAMLLIMGAIGLTHRAEAGPGNGVAPNQSADIVSGQTAKQVNYVDAGVHTMPNTTPVSTSPKCSLYGDLHAVEIRLIGTMAGTAPQVTLQWQNSKDGGSTWNAVQTPVVINATTTPAVTNLSAADVKNGLSSTAYGDCWNVKQTWSGSGTVTANYEIVGVDK